MCTRQFASRRATTARQLRVAQYLGLDVGVDPGRRGRDHDFFRVELIFGAGEHMAANLLPDDIGAAAGRITRSARERTSQWRAAGAATGRGRIVGRFGLSFLRAHGFLNRAAAAQRQCRTR